MTMINLYCRIISVTVIITKLIQRQVQSQGFVSFEMNVIYEPIYGGNVQGFRNKF